MEQKLLSLGVQVQYLDSFRQVSYHLYLLGSVYFGSLFIYFLNSSSADTLSI